eukprot:713252-Rhodomonas_salina.1
METRCNEVDARRQKSSGLAETGKRRREKRAVGRARQMQRRKEEGESIWFAPQTSLGVLLCGLNVC